MADRYELDRRAFFKLGAAGAVTAALQNKSHGVAPISKGKLTCPPSLASLGSDRLTYRFRDLFNCPAAMNELGYAQVGKSVSAITAIAFPPYACCGVPDTAWSPGYLLTCEMFLNGRFLAIAAAPDGDVQYRWFSHCVERSQVAERLQFTTRMFLPPNKRAVAQSISIKNLSSTQRRFTLACDLRGAVAKKTTAWFANSPGEADNEITWDEKRGCLLFTARHSSVAAAQGFRPAPDRCEHGRMLVFEIELRAGEEKRLNFIVSIADNTCDAQQQFDEMQSNFASLEEQNRVSFERLVRSAFTPENSEFSGNLPRLVTNDESLWKLYHNGIASLLFARRVSPDSAYGPTYLTLSGHVLPTLSFPWDTSLSSLALALLDPQPLRKLVETWLKWDCMIIIPPTT